jgi:hypothetical protein
MEGSMMLAKRSPPGRLTESDCHVHSGEVAPAHLSLRQLIRACEDETARYRRRASCDGAYGVELFRRAVCERDDHAWAAAVAVYHSLVRAWVRRHPARQHLDEADDYWVTRAFERFWMAIGPDRFATFATIAALLRYVKLCVHSVLHDAMRDRGSGLAAVPESIPDVRQPERDVIHRLHTRALIRVIEGEVRDDAERLIVSLCLMQGSKPRDVFARYPELFASVADVYRVKRNLLDRLRRNPAVQALWD